MAWIESHQELRDHPKVKRLARLIGTSVPAALGHLHCLWWWAMDYADDGDVSRYDEFDLAEAALWDGDATTFVKALQSCGPGGTSGFLDDSQLHDWWDYAGKLVERRQRDRERKAKARTKPVRGTSDGHPQEVSETAYVPNPTQPTQPNLLAAEAADSGLPTKADEGKTYSRTLGEWAERCDPAPEGADRNELARWLVRVIQKHAPHAGLDQAAARNLARFVILDYLAAVTGSEPTQPTWGYLGRLIGTSGATVVLDAVIVAVESGAGLTEPYASDPLSLLKYATAVKNGKGKAA